MTVDAAAIAEEAKKAADVAAIPEEGGGGGGDPLPEIVNPLSGERITIVSGGAGDGALVWELLLAPGGRVPSGHAHPRQEERFTVTEGRVRFRIGWRRVLAGPGDTVVVAPGRPHHFANPGPAPARVLVRTTPALGMRELLETAAGLARERHAAGRRLPRLADMALFMRDFEAEVAAPVAPGMTRHAARALAAVAGRRGPGARYRRLRGDSEGSGDSGGGGDGGVRAAQ